MRNWLNGVMAVSMVAAFGGSAKAVPMFTNPNFTSTSTTTTFAYSQPITGWNDVSGPGSATGISTANPNYLWDNGIAPNGETMVAFLQNETAALQQTVGGFVVGHQYQIVVLADARAITGPAGLSIGVNGTEYGAQLLSPTPVSAVDPYGVYQTAWAAYSSAIFTAGQTSNLIQLQNIGIPGSTTFDDVTIDLGSASIQDVTPAPVSAPEPASLAILGLGIGVAILIRGVRGDRFVGLTTRRT